MDLKEVLKQMEEGQEKVAAAQRGTPAVVPQEANALAAALEKAAAAITPEEKGATDAVNALQVVAEKLAAQEREADLAHANLCGQAFADGAINKFAAWDAVTKMAMAQQTFATPIPGQVAQYQSQSKLATDQTVPMEKWASSDPVLMEKVAVQRYLGSLTQADLQRATPQELQKLAEIQKAAQFTREDLMKIAAEEGDQETLYKLAAEQGYADTMEKAAADYEAGAQQALQEVHSLATGEFLKGAAEAEILINHYRQQAGQ